MELSEDMSSLQRQVADHQSLPKECYRDDFIEKRNPAHPQNKKRTLRDLSAAARLEIVTLAAKRVLTQQEVADRFGIKVQVVRDLMKNLGKKRSVILKKRDAEVRKARQQSALTSVISQSLTSKQGIWSSKQIQAEIKERIGVEVSKRAVVGALKGKFNLSYRRVKRVSFSGNSEHNRVLRSLYAQKMFKVYRSRSHVVNLDESWLPEADFRRANWDARGQPHSVPAKLMGRKVNMIVAVSSEGFVWLSLTQVNTDEDVMQLFLSRLA